MDEITDIKLELNFAVSFWQIELHQNKQSKSKTRSVSGSNLVLD